MERLNEYREIIRTFLEESIAPSSDDPNFETQLICDSDRDHYQLVSLGWQGHRRFYTVLIHLDIKDGKVWIQRNDTDRLIAQELVALGVGREDIVLGLQPAYARGDTGYSVA
ncbi:MAG: XisI protein [Alkalinema sp. RU_4_3]|nr:XisI protein [Alkalinema sp. RU_4_3]